MATNQGFERTLLHAARSRKEHQKTIKDILKPPKLKEGESWYLLDACWFKKWKTMLSNVSTEQLDESDLPGRIDNSALLSESFHVDRVEIRPNLTVTFDYVLLSGFQWEKIVRWFKLAEGQIPIERKVIRRGLYAKQLKVEIYLMELEIRLYDDNKMSKNGFFSRTEKIKKVVQDAKKYFGIHEKTSARLSTCCDGFRKTLENLDETLQDACICDDYIVYLEVQQDGTWPELFQYLSSAAEKRVAKGLTGLSNLGNTCFMNSCLQCLSNVPQLTDYFLTNEYKRYINKFNPSGQKGQIAEAYGCLMQKMWGGRPTVAPQKLKLEVSRYAPQFAGSRQHDSQEFMTFLLDGLLEDLNIVTEKPYIERKATDGTNDEYAAEEAWHNHLLRNRSVIVDLFQGQVKTVVTCSSCKTPSITFDSLMYLALPLPSEKTGQNKLSIEPETHSRDCSLKDCIELFTATKLLGENNFCYCSSCMSMQRAEKCMKLWKLPTSLVVYLKRFSKNYLTKGKLDTFIDFQIKGLDMNPYVESPENDGQSMLYDLCAVANHFGSFSGGHYTSFCKNVITGKWYEFNDSLVTEVTDVEKSVKSKNAYILIYIRRSDERMERKRKHSESDSQDQSNNDDRAAAKDHVMTT